MNLFKIIKKTGLSLDTLGEKINVSKSTLNKWKSGERTPDPEKVDIIYYLAKEINPASWNTGIIDYYNATKDGTGTLRLLDVVNDGIGSIRETDFELLKALKLYLSESAAMLADEIIDGKWYEENKKSGKEES